MTLRINGVFDIETESWDTFVLGGIMDSAGVYRSTTDENEMVDWLLTVGGHYWTWNGGLYDTLWLAEHLRKKGLRFTCALAGPRITRLECEGLVVRDAIALIPMPLKKAASIASIALSKDTGLPCKCGSACGGYCSISRSLGAEKMKRLDGYLREDCRTSLAVLEAVVAEADRCGYLLTGTVGGSSYKTLSGIAELDNAKWPDAETYKLARAGYYGGRVEVFQPRAARGFSYDINSAYPAALTRVALPVGPRLRVTGEKARRAFKRGKEGIFVARVEVPARLHLPPLPVRTGVRVVYPVGPIHGAWTALELRGALERGCAAEIDRGLVWGDSETVMASALLIGWQNRARAAAEGNPSLAAWHKWFCNSFTGKLAEAPEKERIVCNPRDEEVRICQCHNRPNHRAGSCRCGAFRPLDKQGQLWGAPFWRLSGCAHVHWAAYLTAWTRLTLLAQLEADGDGGRSAVYCDTDSVKATAPRDQGSPDELGGWKDEGEWSDFQAIAPKVYRYRGGDGLVTVRGKGLPGLDSSGFDAFSRGAPVVVDRGVRSLRSAGRSGGSLFTRRHLERANHADGLHFGGRVLKPDGFTYPQTLREIEAWQN